MANKKKKTADDYSMDIARYMMAGLPVPKRLMDNLMKIVCEEEKAKHVNKVQETQNAG